MAVISTFYDHVTDISKQEGISVPEALAEVKKLGIDLLELSQNNILGRVEEVEKELSGAGLGIFSIPSYFNFGRDTDVDAQSTETLEAARYLGVSHMLVIPGFFAPEDDDESRERQMENIISCINRLGEKAAGYGVDLLMENFDNAASPIHAAPAILRVLNGCPGLSFCFDTGNFRFAGEDVLEAVDKFTGRIGQVHLKDRAFSSEKEIWHATALDGTPLYPAPVGGGELPMDEVVEKLRRNGFDGTFTIEHYGSPAALEYMRASAAWVKKALA